jgi:hypothetical protein
LYSIVNYLSEALTRKLSYLFQRRSCAFAAVTVKTTRIKLEIALSPSLTPSFSNPWTTSLGPSQRGIHIHYPALLSGPPLSLTLSSIVASFFSS